MFKAVTIPCFLLLCNLCQAQVPNFFADSARWVYETDTDQEPGAVWDSSSEQQNTIDGDTVIGGLTYFKLYTMWHQTVEVFHPPSYHHYYGSVGPSFLRYDTIEKKVYYLPALDSTERLIYDFELQVGDTTPMQAEHFLFTTVSLIDTVTIFGVSLRRFFLTDESQNTADDRNYILEGIGGSNGLTYYQPEATLLSGGIPMTGINCFQYQDSIYAPFSGECPFIDFVDAIHPVKEDYSLTVSPNPTRDVFTISVDDELLNATCTIVDATGRVVQLFTLTDLHTTTQLQTPGIYFWRVEQRGRLIDCGMLICQ